MRARIPPCIRLILVLSLALFPSCDSRTLNFWAVWFRRPYKGPMCVVEVVGADLNIKSNSIFDHWSKPDIMVEVVHDKWDRKTHIEGNTFQPRFLWQSKMAYKPAKGFTFTVYDVDVVKGNSVIGRAYLPPDEAVHLIKSHDSKLLSIGDGIGMVKINIFNAPIDLTSAAVPLLDATRESDSNKNLL